MPKVRPAINATVVDNELARLADAVDEVRFRVACAEADPVMRLGPEDRELTRDYDKSVQALERLARELPTLIAAARDPFAPGNAQRLENGYDLFDDFNECVDGTALSILWDAGRSIRLDQQNHPAHRRNVCAVGGNDAPTK